MLDMLTKILPIILLFGLGYLIRRRDLIPRQGIDAIKSIIMNLALPAIFFKTFLTMAFEVEQLAIPVLIITLLLTIFIVGKISTRIKVIGHKINPYIAAGFSFGLLGIPVFPIIFGQENLGLFLLIGLGHELFVGCFIHPFVQIDFNNKGFKIKQLLNILKSPILISIVLGLVLNILGVERLFFENQFFNGIYGTLDYLSDLATPLILIAIGFDMEIKKHNIMAALKIVVIRLVIVFGVGYIFKTVVINQVIETTQIFNCAYLTFLILPPMFSLPILVALSGVKEDEELANNAVILSTALSFVMLIGLAFLSTIVL